MVVGLCGRSGSGKSVICSELKKMGAFIIDADLVAREIMKGEVLERIDKAFPGCVKDGILNRKKLASVVFSDSGKLLELNRITHTAIKEEISRRIKSSSCEYIVVDAPVLIEASMQDMFDCTACIVSSDELRLERIISRDGIGKAEADARLSAQNTDEFYMKNTDFYIVNDGRKSPQMLAQEFLEVSKAVVMGDGN